MWMIWVAWALILISAAALLAHGGCNYHKIENTTQRWHTW